MDYDIVEKKEKLTLYLDESVAKVFKAMGNGYQARINRILATWVQMKMAEMRELEIDYMDALDTTRSEREAADPEDLSARRKRSVEEHWAYLQGVKDGGR